MGYRVRVTNRELTQMRALRDSGLTLKDIARRLKRSTITVRKHLKTLEDSLTDETTETSMGTKETDPTLVDMVINSTALTTEQKITVLSRIL